MKDGVNGMRFKLSVMNFLQFAIWGAYLTSMGTYLYRIGLGERIGLFYAMQGFVSLFMPAIMGIVADRWVPAQKLLGFCHLMGAIFMASAGCYAMNAGDLVEFTPLYILYAGGIGFYMPTLALSNSVAYTALERIKLDPVVVFPSIRIFGTIGFICSMLMTDFFGFQASYKQFLLSAVISLITAGYVITLPACPVNKGGTNKSFVEAMGLRAFTLFKQKKMAVFFIFSMFLGVSLQITNGYANPFISSFANVTEYAETFGVQHANVLISISQISETLCILLIPFALKHFGIKNVMLIAMCAWVLRFALFGLGNPGSRVWMLILSMIVYGIAFDFFNISGSLFVNKETDLAVRSSAQGLFVLMTNGFGATIGILCAQGVVNHWVDMKSTVPQMEGWSMIWFIFASYAMIVTILFAIIFKYKHQK